MAPRRPLISIELQQPSEEPDLQSSTIDAPVPPKRWYHYLPLCVTVLLILAPHPSLLYVLVNHHLRARHQPINFLVHLFVTYGLTFMTFSSLIICVTRDPGTVSSKETKTDEVDDEEVGVTEALMSDDFDAFGPGKWCRKCWAPKPERAHHCGQCGRCVLKMDHHCPWLGNRCIGHRTYPAFLHFLLCVTLLALYIAIISISALYFAFTNPFSIDETTPLHELFLAFDGAIFSFVIGSFFGYHVYLVTTNQTTIENISPFLILRHLPALPRSGHGLSDPPLEAELNYQQRRLVKDAHGSIHIYNVGWKKNWAQVCGWSRPYGWMYRILYGGATCGDGRAFPRNPKSDAMLARLANELVKIDMNR